MSLSSSSNLMTERDNSNVLNGSFRRRWNSTSRRDRAVIRILASHGMSPVKISNYVRFSYSSVERIIEGLLPSYADEDESQDYNFVSDAFKAKYPPPAASERNSAFSKREKERKLDVTGVNVGELPSITISRVTVTPSSVGKPSQRNQRNQYLHPVSSSSRISAASHPQAPSMGQFISAPGPTKHPIVTYQSRVKAESSGSKANPIKLDLDSPPTKELNLDPPVVADELPHPVVKFLSRLDHDLSEIYDMLSAQDLGTTEKLLSIRGWPEDTLHRLFKEALPNVSVTQRFVLVKGLKDYVLEA